MSFRDLPEDVYSNIGSHLSKREFGQLRPLTRSQFQPQTSNRCLEQEETFRKLTGMEMTDLIDSIRDQREMINHEVDIWMENQSKNCDKTEFYVEEEVLSYFYKLFTFSSGTSLEYLVIKHLVRVATGFYFESFPDDPVLKLRMKEVEKVLKDQQLLEDEFKQELKGNLWQRTIDLPFPNEISKTTEWFHD